jgi:hypothetical protein
MKQPTNEPTYLPTNKLSSPQTIQKFSQTANPSTSKPSNKPTKTEVTHQPIKYLTNQSVD